MGPVELATVQNRYFKLPPKKVVTANAPCPCGSKKKFKKCCQYKRND